MFTQAQIIVICLLNLFFLKRYRQKSKSSSDAFSSCLLLIFKVFFCFVCSQHVHSSKTSERELVNTKQIDINVRLRVINQFAYDLTNESAQHLYVISL